MGEFPWDPADSAGPRPSLPAWRRPRGLSPAEEALVAPLPEAVRAAAREAAAAGNGEVIAGILVRWALTQAPGREAGVRSPLYRAAMDWWAAVPSGPGGKAEVEAIAEHAAGAFGEDVGCFAGGFAGLDAGVVEALALRRDTLESVAFFLLVVGAGDACRRALAEADEWLRLLYAESPVERFTSEYLDAIARRGAGWWAVAPKGTAPELDGDVDTDLGADVAEWMEEEE
jgi:hypothetical protein